MSSQVFISHNPATGEKLWSGPSATQHDVDEAVASARSALEKWSHLSFEKRINHLIAYKDVLTSEKDAMAETISQETGKPLWDSKGEVLAMINKVAISIDAYQKRCTELILEQPHALSITRHKPHGVIAVLGPYNFPGHLPNGHIIPALLAGNTVVFKPSELTPLVGEKMIALWKKSGLPQGVINLVQGLAETGKFLSKHPGIDGLLFTGSWPTGKSLAATFAETPQKILALEMGGNNPLIVSSLSNIKAAAYITVQSAFLSSGQRCTCARRLIVIQNGFSKTFQEQLIAMIKAIQVGAYTDTPEPFMGPVISLAAAKKLLETQKKLQDSGGKSLVPMQHLKNDLPFLSPGLIDVTDIRERSDEELFGPLLQLIRVPDINSAIEEANHTAYGLSAGLLSDSLEEYELFYQKIRAGVVNWNTQLTGASSSAPFGGIGKSGNHRPSAFYAADYCAFPVASLENKTLQMPSTIAPGITLT